MLEVILYLVVLVAVVGSVLDIPTFFTDLAIQWLTSALVGCLLSLVAGTLVEAFTGDFLKKITLTFEIMGRNISISAFAVATLIAKVWLFGF